jgi:hypothetical protein
MADKKKKITKEQMQQDWESNNRNAGMGPDNQTNTNSESAPDIRYVDKKMLAVAQGAAPKIVPIELNPWGDSTNDQNTYLPTKRDETVDAVKKELRNKPYGKRSKRSRGAKYILGEY